MLAQLLPARLALLVKRADALARFRPRARLGESRRGFAGQRRADRRPFHLDSPARDDARAALLEGRWSLVDRFDSDGRRFIVAYRNPPGVLNPRRLTAREREVAARILDRIAEIRIASGRSK